MWYHFAFMAISIAMFGMTFGTILVYLLPGRFNPEHRGHHMGLASLLMGLTVILSFLAHLGLPYLFASGPIMEPGRWLISVSLTFMITLVPFIFSGIAITLALTGLPYEIGRLYATDLGWLHSAGPAGNLRRPDFISR